MRFRWLTLILAALAIAAAGCGDDDDSDSGGGGGGNSGGGAVSGGGDDDGADKAAEGGGTTKLELAAPPDGALKFNRSSLEAKPGKVTIAFDNPSRVPHAVEVEGKGVEEETEVITDSSANLSVDLEAGEYKFYCPVGNHEQAGMVGTLTVR